MNKFLLPCMVHFDPLPPPCSTFFLNNPQTRIRHDPDGISENKLAFLSDDRLSQLVEFCLFENHQAHFRYHISFFDAPTVGLKVPPTQVSPFSRIRSNFSLSSPFSCRFSELVMFCGKCEADKELKFIANLSSSSPHLSEVSHNQVIRQTSSKVIMARFFVLAGWKTRIDPGDWHSSWDNQSIIIWLVYERNKFILLQDLLLDYRFKMGR